MCDASLYAAGFILFIEEPHDSSTAKSKTYAPLAFASRLFSTAQLKHSIEAKIFFGIQLAFYDKTITVLSDNKRVTRFFQSKKWQKPLGFCFFMFFQLIFSWGIYLDRQMLQQTIYHVFI